MDVILMEDVDKVGLRGDVVSVSRGFMRNYLRPRRLAEEATPARVAELERREALRARHEARTFEEAQQLAATLGATELRFDVNAGPTGTLFGSVTPTDIADELWRVRKIRLDRRKIDLPDPIKRIGRYQVPIDVFTDVRAEVRTLVVPAGGELPPEEELEAMARAEEAAEAEAAEEAEVAAEAVEAEIDAFEAEAAEEPVAAEPESGPESAAAEASGAEAEAGDAAEGEGGEAGREPGGERT